MHLKLKLPSFIILYLWPALHGSILVSSSRLSFTSSHLELAFLSLSNLWSTFNKRISPSFPLSFTLSISEPFLSLHQFLAIFSYHVSVFFLPCSSSFSDSWKHTALLSYSFHPFLPPSNLHTDSKINIFHPIGPLVCNPHLHSTLSSLSSSFHSLFISDQHISYSRLTQPPSPHPQPQSLSIHSIHLRRVTVSLSRHSLATSCLIIAC